MASFSLGHVTSVLLCVVSIVALTVLCGGFLYGLLYFDLEDPKYKPQAPECAGFYLRNGQLTDNPAVGLVKVVGQLRPVVVKFQYCYLLFLQFYLAYQAMR